jgi:hypothetical protein
MKRKITIFVLLLALAGSVFAQTQVTGLLPKDSRSMGMGGSFRVFSLGYDTFYGNPAGFAYKTGSLTLLDTAMWAYIKPTSSNIQKAMDLAQGKLSTSDSAAFVNDLIVNNGLGAGAAVGLGWAGGDFGLGLTVVSDNVASGSSLLGSILSTRSQANAILGLGFPINLGIFRFRLGADGRAFYLLQSPGTGWPFSNIAMAIISSGSGSDPMPVVRSQSIIGGYGFAADAGATLDIGPFMAGVMVRDLGFGFKMKTTNVGTILDTTSVPTNGTDPYQLTPVYTAGLGLRLFPNGIFSPSVYLEADDPLTVVSAGLSTIWNKIHAGAELRLLKFLALRAGLNKGWVSMGAGLDLSLVEIDAALFTEEMGANPGDKGRTGISVQAAIRFGQ